MGKRVVVEVEGGYARVVEASEGIEVVVRDYAVCKEATWKGTGDGSVWVSEKVLPFMCHNCRIGLGDHGWICDDPREVAVALMDRPCTDKNRNCFVDPNEL